MERVTKRYTPVRIGAAGDVANNKPGTLPIDIQTTTFLISVATQIAVLVTSSIALGNNNQPYELPPLLLLVIWLELVVQSVELLWYISVGTLFILGRGSIAVKWRYLDWSITTPLMMVSVLLFTEYLACESATAATFFADGSKTAAMVVVVVFDLAMLLIGFFYEAEFASITTRLDFYGPGSGLWLGWVPFLGIFIPQFVHLATNYTVWGLVTVLTTAVTWALYGVAALVFRTPESAKLKNSTYNVLDILSKNLTGLLTAIVAMGISGATTPPTWNTTVCD